VHVRAWIIAEHYGAALLLNGQVAATGRQSPHSCMDGIMRMASCVWHQLCVRTCPGFVMKLNQRFVMKLNQRFVMKLNQRFVMKLNQRFVMKLNQRQPRWLLSIDTERSACGINISTVVSKHLADIFHCVTFSLTGENLLELY